MLKNRHPWRTRAKLLAFVDAAAGVATALGVLAVILGITGDLDAWNAAVAAGTAAAVDFVAILANVKIVTDGEDETTPIHDALGPHGDFMVEFPQYEKLAAALADSVVVLTVVDQLVEPIPAGRLWGDRDRQE
jgi:microcompartment protein CcmL/EutN